MRGIVWKVVLVTALVLAATFYIVAARENSSKNARLSDVLVLRTGLLLYAQQNGNFPPSLNVLAEAQGRKDLGRFNYVAANAGYQKRGSQLLFYENGLSSYLLYSNGAWVVYQDRDEFLPHVPGQRSTPPGKDQ